MFVCETPRLFIRRLSSDDAAFLVQLLNEPSFLENIGDRGVRSLDDARGYVAKGPGASYEKYGFGLFHVALKESREPIGMSGLLKRDWLEDVDVGYALLPQYFGKGYAFESAQAVIEWGRREKGIQRVCGIVKPDNTGSIRVLEKLGLKFDRFVSSPEGLESRLFI
jgi:[ribosomal protein S5]-alanine N-acetyltransferase